jgi:hypothetical protein
MLNPGTDLSLDLGETIVHKLLIGPVARAIVIGRLLIPAKELNSGEALHLIPFACLAVCGHVDCPDVHDAFEDLGGFLEFGGGVFAVAAPWGCVKSITYRRTRPARPRPRTEPGIRSSSK